MPFTEVDQSSVDWLKMRVGCVGASRLCDVMAKLKRKDGEAAVRLNYRKAKVVEELTGMSQEAYVSPAMEHGIEWEPVARAKYEMVWEREVLGGGIYFHDEIPRFEASPDGRVGDDGLIEIKCPTTTEHIDVLSSGIIPPDYELQMLGQMACSGRQWVDFVSFDPRVPKHLQMFVKRFPRNDERIKQVEDEVIRFLSEVVAELKTLADYTVPEPERIAEPF